MTYMNILARPEGLEPPTPRFEAWYSIQLSYGRVGGDCLRVAAVSRAILHRGEY